MEPISFIVPVTPASMQGACKRAMCMGGRVVFFKEKRAKDWIKVVGFYANPHAPKKPIEGAIKMTVTFVMKRPASLNAKKFTTGRIPCAKRPDTDNLCKCLTDSLIGFWEDDAQITELHASKWYAAKTEQPKIVITIESINTDERTN